jgi:hypothetical protein
VINHLACCFIRKEKGENILCSPKDPNYHPFFIYDSKLSRVTFRYIKLPSFVKKAPPLASNVEVPCDHFDEILPKVLPLLTLEILELSYYN